MSNNISFNNTNIYQDFYNLYNYENIETYEYDFIFSIGENCFSASILSKNNMRISSSPFDWVTPSNFSRNNLIMNMDIINNRFKNFFDYDSLSFSCNTDYGKASYLNSRTNLYFPHDFTINCNFKKEYKEIKSKYDRRINNLINKLESNKKILMVYIEYYRLNNDFTDINRIIDYISYIRETYGNKNIDLLYIKHNYYINDKKIYFKNIDNKIHLYILDNSFNSISNEQGYGEGWCCNVEKTDKILSLYRLKNSK